MYFLPGFQALLVRDEMVAWLLNMTLPDETYAAISGSDYERQ